MLNALAKVLSGIDKISEYVGKAFSFLVILMVILQVIEVFRRYVLEAPTIWNWELVMLLYGAHFVMGGAWVLKNDGHVRTDVIYHKLHPKQKAWLDLILFTCIFFVFAVVMTYKGTLHALYSISVNERTYTLWAPPFWPLKILFALGFIMLLLQGLAKWLRDLIFIVKGERI